MDEGLFSSSKKKEKAMAVFDLCSKVFEQTCLLTLKKKREKSEKYSRNIVVRNLEKSENFRVQVNFSACCLKFPISSRFLSFFADGELCTKVWCQKSCGLDQEARSCCWVLSTPMNFCMKLLLDPQ